jgi:hypothetical protein
MAASSQAFWDQLMLAQKVFYPWGVIPSVSSSNVRSLQVPGNVAALFTRSNLRAARR